MTMITPSYLGETIEYSSLHACRSTLEDPTSDMVRMDLRDDGEGFDLSAKSDGFGLLGMRDRVARMGGQLTIQSAPGEGTGVSIAIPIIGRSALATG